MHQIQGLRLLPRSSRLNKSANGSIATSLSREKTGKADLAAFDTSSSSLGIFPPGVLGKMTLMPAQRL